MTTVNDTWTLERSHAPTSFPCRVELAGTDFDPSLVLEQNGERIVLNRQQYTALREILRRFPSTAHDELRAKQAAAASKK